MLRWWIVAVYAGLGLLQAWDSGVFDQGLAIVLLVLAAIVLPAVALAWATKARTFVVATIASFGLLVLARITASEPLNELFLITVIAAIAMAVLHRLRPEDRRSKLALVVLLAIHPSLSGSLQSLGRAIDSRPIVGDARGDHGLDPRPDA